MGTWGRLIETYFSMINMGWVGEWNVRVTYRGMSINLEGKLVTPDVWVSNSREEVSNSK